MSLEEALEDDPEVLRELLAEFLRDNPEELVKLEEEVKKIDPAIVTEMQRQKPLLPTPYRPWVKRLSDAQKWLSEQEAKRLDSDNIERPNTKWVFESFFNVEVKVVLDSQDPLVGTGRLPDWLAQPCTRA